MSFVSLNSESSTSRYPYDVSFDGTNGGGVKSNGVGDAVGCGVGVALGVDVACAEALGDGDGLVEPVGVAVGVAVGRAVPVGADDGLALAEGTELAVGVELADVLATLDGDADGDAWVAVGVADATAVADDPGLGVGDDGVPPPPLHAATSAVDRARPTRRARWGNDIRASTSSERLLRTIACERPLLKRRSRELLLNDR